MALIESGGEEFPPAYERTSMMRPTMLAGNHLAQSPNPFAFSVDDRFMPARLRNIERYGSADVCFAYQPDEPGFEIDRPFKLARTDPAELAWLEQNIVLEETRLTRTGTPMTNPDQQRILKIMGEVAVKGLLEDNELFFRFLLGAAGLTDYPTKHIPSITEARKFLKLANDHLASLDKMEQGPQPQKKHEIAIQKESTGIERKKGSGLWKVLEYSAYALVEGMGCAFDMMGCLVTVAMSILMPTMFVALIINPIIDLIIIGVVISAILAVALVAMPVAYLADKYSDANKLKNYVTSMDPQELADLVQKTQQLLTEKADDVSAIEYLNSRPEVLAQFFEDEEVIQYVGLLLSEA